jgi:hypothetical protein
MKAPEISRLMVLLNILLVPQIKAIDFDYAIDKKSTAQRNEV